MKGQIRPSEDSKTKFSKSERNTFGLPPGPPPGGSCPGATCGRGGCWLDCGSPVCYAWRLTRFRPAAAKVLEHNMKLLKSCSGRDRVDILVREFLRFKYGDGGKFYRLHWSGDFFSAAYARDLMEACSKVPDVTFWNFTRNFSEPVVAAIAEHKPDNVVQYVSADAVNLEQAAKTAEKFPGTFKFSYMGACKPEGFPGLKDCPANFPHKNAIEFMCSKCRMCLKGRPVFFRTRGAGVKQKTGEDK